VKLVENKRAVLAGILLFGLLAMTARPALDSDLWWHLRTGQLIVETGHVPHTDPFSFTRSGQPWIAHEWLSEVIFYLLWKFGGAAALIVFTSLVTTAGFLLLYARCQGAAHWAAAATVLGAVASAPCWGTRAQMFTFTFASLLLWLVGRATERPALLFWIAPLFVVWVNLHAGFALAPVLLLLIAAGLVVETATGATPAAEARPLLGRILVAVVACIALVPLNPSGTRLYRYPFDTVKATDLRSLIVEWQSPDFHSFMSKPFLAVILLLIAGFASKRIHARARTLVPLFFLLFSALDAVRHIPIFMLVAVPLLCDGMSSAPAAIAYETRRRRRASPAFNAAVLIFLGGFALWRWTTVARGQESQEAKLFPETAVTYLSAHASSQPGKLFAYYDWGGYAIWKLYPHYRMFVDGRSDLYGDEFLKQFETAMGVHKGWRATLDKPHVEAVLIPPDTPLAQALLLDPSWTSPCGDSVGLLFVRRAGGAPTPGGN
jgi:hypothetical protein